jgi:P27 family predicted phage terminase small subunit
MSVMGRPPKPTALRKLQGNPGHRPLPTGEPQPELGVPSRPEWLLPEAKREWNRIVPELERLGLLAKVDRALIAAYCQCWARYVAAEKDIRANGESYVTDKGYEGPRPSVAIARAMIEKLTALSAKFGFTPSDRARIRVPEPEQKDPFEEFLRDSGQLAANE